MSRNGVTPPKGYHFDGPRTRDFGSVVGVTLVRETDGRRWLEELPAQQRTATVVRELKLKLLRRMAQAKP